MVNVGRVTPHFTVIGELAARIGRFKIDPASNKTPLRYVQYTPVNNLDNLIGWQRIASGELQVAPDSVLYFDFTLLHAFTNPQSSTPGALLIRREQLENEVNQTLRKIVPTLDQYSSWLVLLPYLSEDGKNAACFTLPTTEATPEEADAFTRDMHEDVPALFRQEGHKILFINPYYLEHPPKTA